MIAREEQFRGHNVLADTPHVLPGKGRSLDAHAAPAVHGHMLDHDHGVAVRGQRLPGIDRETGFAFAQQQGLAFACGKGVRRAHGKTVHGRRVTGGRGIAGVHGFMQHPAHGLLRRAEFPARQKRADVVLAC